MKSTLWIALCLFLSAQGFSQTRVIRGELTAFNRYPVANVEVTAKKAKTSVTTNEEGVFQLVCNEKDVLIIKSEVFTSLNQRVGSKDDYLKLNLIFRDTPENREIATGMGYLKADQLTYALANLDSENNDFCNYSDVLTLITGKFSGVEVMTTESGNRGVFVRGQKTIQGSAEAMYVVDGIPMDDITFVNPCEMKSITVLKDGAAAMYGSRGANGVVVIETKGYLH
ncbi:MAG: TonB-dependent receptor plug domain-containing protein [Bacteroidales bacterium]